LSIYEAAGEKEVGSEDDAGGLLFKWCGVLGLEVCRVKVGWMALDEVLLMVLLMFEGEDCEAVEVSDETVDGIWGYGSGGDGIRVMVCRPWKCRQCRERGFDREKERECSRSLIN
jgi:hypothetical protein